MLRWAGGKTKKDHIKNEDIIWREANDRQGEIPPRDVEYSSAGKEKKGETQEKMAGQHQYRMPEDTAQNRSVCHMKRIAGPLLREGGLSLCENTLYLKYRLTPSNR